MPLRTSGKAWVLALGAFVHLAHSATPQVNLNFSDVGGVAVAGNPRLVAERTRKSIAEAQLVAAGVLPNPQLAVAGDAPAWGATQGAQAAGSASLSWEPTTLIARGNSMQAASSGLEQVELEVAWQEWLVKTRARRLFRRAAWLEREVKLARELEGQLVARVTTLEALSQAGDATVLELASARATADQLTIDRIGLELEQLAAGQALRQTLGLSSETELNLDPAGIDEDSEGVAPDALTSGVEARRPDLLALERGAAAQESKQKAASLSRLPRLSLGPVVTRDAAGLGTVGVAATMDLPVLDRAQARIAVASAAREQVVAERNARLFEAKTDLGRLVRQLSLERALVAALDQSAPRLEALVRVYEAGLKERVVDTLSTFAAVQNLYRRRLAALRQRRSIGELLSDLEVASGRLIERKAAP